MLLIAKGLFLGMFVMMLAIMVLLIIAKKPIAKKTNRKLIVRCYKILHRLGLIIISITMGIMELGFLVYMYKINYVFLKVSSGSDSFAAYVALSISLITSAPLTLLIFKFIKRKEYIDAKKGKGSFVNDIWPEQMQSMFFVMLDDITPLYNFIHDNQMTKALISEPSQEYLILL